MGHADWPFADIHMLMNHFKTRFGFSGSGGGGGEGALRVCIFNQLSGNTGALVLGSHFE